MSFNSEMTNLADAIRAKSGVSGRLTIAGMTDAVEGIEITQGSDIDFTGVNVTSNKMLAGTVAINASGNKVTGNIQTVTATKDGNRVTVPSGHIASQQIVTVGTAKSAATITPGISDQTIAADTYLSGKQTIKGDANLTAENIKSGVRIFAVTGTFEGSGGGGSGGGAVDLYKCVSVDESAQTWTGRKAVMEDNQYTIKTAETSGLSSVGGMKIEKGKVYSADGKFRVSRAYNHCICVAPFTYSASPVYGECKITVANQCYIDTEEDAPTGFAGYGQALKFNVTAISGNDLTQAYFNFDNLPVLDAFAFEFWCYSNKNPSYYSIKGAIFLQNKATGNLLTAPDTFIISAQTGWHHVALSRTAGSSIVKAYIDGNYVCDCSFSDIIGGEDGVKITFANQWWINNFVFYDYAKYTGNFTPSQELNVPEWEDPQTLTVSGAGIEDVNGIYELITPTASGRDRIWAKPNTGYLVKYHDEWWSWTICNGLSTLYSGNEDSEPWESEWWDATDDESGGDSPTVTLN